MNYYQKQDYRNIPFAERLKMFAEKYGFVPDFKQVALLAGTSTILAYQYVRGNENVSCSLKSKGVDVPELGYDLPQNSVPAAFEVPAEPEDSNVKSRFKEQIRSIWQEQLVLAAERGDVIKFYQINNILKDLGE